jgi:CheY-like chemotaxis protein
MMNLSTNAYHAMRERGGTVTIELRAMEVDAGFASGRIDLHPGPYAVLCVSDTGYGMDAEVLKRIFDPYFTTKGVGEGTGLGLAVVHGIVKSHRGAIDVRSEPGGGSRFQIYLPICAEIAAIEESGEREFAVPGGSERILLVDDEELIVELEKTFLERLGYRVSAFTQSPNALEAFQTQPDAFDLAITDFTMPGLTGTELAKAMLARRPGFPIILCTGFSESMDENRAKALGIRRFVLKPVLNRELARAVRAVLDGE